MGRPTITDVATAAGVSKGAVSFALNGRPGISAETRQRILATAEDLGWTPSARARALSISRSLAVGLVSPGRRRSSASTPSSRRSSRAWRTALSARGHALLLQVAEHDDLATYRRLAQEARVDGVLLTDLRVDDERPALLEELGLPCVLIGPELSYRSFATQSAVWHDDAEGIRSVVRHLVELGHTRIAHVAGPQQPGPRPLATSGLERRPSRTPACPTARASTPTSRRSPAPARWASCSTSRTDRPRSSSPTT